MRPYLLLLLALLWPAAVAGVIALIARPPLQLENVPAILWAAAGLQVVGLIPAVLAYRHARGMPARLLSAVAISVNIGVLAWVITVNGH